MSGSLRSLSVMVGEGGGFVQVGTLAALLSCTVRGWT